ncbi:hypothetical protein [Sphaerisporangium corydalis]|uniref:DUF1707 domain-containing protein n=1 Tax=Sphaerisporangium corydalis TaxID=1441875 RepID=A0ABV9EEH4_9ACTN|nr:hypothetical protein [Sphaerisporangium corydalis]
MPDNTLPRDELRATVEARRELGPDYEHALIESFIEKIDAAIDTRVRSEVAAQNGYGHQGAPFTGQHQGQGKAAKQVDGTIPIALGSLGIGIPLTAIAATQAGPAGLFLAWTGIILVNVAAAFGRRRR